MWRLAFRESVSAPTPFISVARAAFGTVVRNNQTHMDSSTGQASDDRKSITGIPSLFDTLVQGGEDPLTATKTVVALLAGEPAS